MKKKFDLFIEIEFVDLYSILISLFVFKCSTKLSRRRLIRNSSHCELIGLEFAHLLHIEIIDSRIGITSTGLKIATTSCILDRAKLRVTVDRH